MSQIFNPGNHPEVWSGTGVTGAGGLLTINFPTPFSSTPAVTVTPQNAATAFYFWHITAVSAASVTIHLVNAGAIVLLGVQLLALPTNAVGVTLHVHAIEQGNFV